MFTKFESCLGVIRFFFKFKASSVKKTYFGCCVKNNTYNY